MGKRLDYIDRAKGFLIILVVIGHIWQSGPVFDLIYSFHMPAFFVISGLLLCETRAYEKKFGKYFLSRLFSFGIPFIWIEVLGCLTDIVRRGVTLNIKGYIMNTLILDFNDPNLWFLACLFLIELLYYWLVKWLKKKPMIFVAAAILFAAYFVIPTANPYIGLIRQAMYYSIFFAVGFCGSDMLKKFNLPACIVSALVVVAVGLLLNRDNARSISLTAIAFLVSGICGAYAVLQLGKVRLPGIMDAALTKAGMNTIIIYGTHHFYYSVIGALLGITDYSTTPIIPGLIILIGVALLEIPTIILINRWAPWLAGKRKQRSAVKEA